MFFCRNVRRHVFAETSFAETSGIPWRREQTDRVIQQGKWSLGLMPFGLKSFGLIQLVTWLNFFKLSVSGIGHLAQSHLT